MIEALPLQSNNVEKKRFPSGSLCSKVAEQKRQWLETYPIFTIENNKNLRKKRRKKRKRKRKMKKKKKKQKKKKRKLNLRTFIAYWCLSSLPWPSRS